MKIGENYSYLSPASSPAASSAPARDSRQVSAGSSGSDSIGGVVMKAADARAAKVEQLKRAVQEGTYKVDAQALSGKIIDRYLGR